VRIYTLSWAAAKEHTPEHPERTARRNAGGSSSMNFDVVFQVWPNRASMLKTIEIQSSADFCANPWKAVRA
jgi:hypothetical protein